MLLPHRLTILKTIMLRRDLSAAAKLLAWFLLLERMNEATSLCYAKNDETLAADIGVNVATIERAKQQLRKASVLDWTVDHSRKIAGFRATYYRFNKTGSYAPAEMRDNNPQKCGSPAKLRDQQSRNSAGQQNTNDPAAERRIAAGLAQLAGKLKAATSNSGAVRAGNASLIPCTDPADDAAQFQHWKSNYLQR